MEAGQLLYCATCSSDLPDSGPDFFQPVHKYRMHLRVTGFTFIQPREVPPAAVRVVLPEITDF